MTEWLQICIGQEAAGRGRGGMEFGQQHRGMVRWWRAKPGRSRDGALRIDDRRGLAGPSEAGPRRNLSQMFDCSRETSTFLPRVLAKSSRRLKTCPPTLANLKSCQLLSLDLSPTLHALQMFKRAR